MKYLGLHPQVAEALLKYLLSRPCSETMGFIHQSQDDQGRVNVGIVGGIVVDVPENKPENEAEKSESLD